MLRPELAWLDRRVAARVDGRPIAVTRVVLGVALMLVSLEQYLALSRIAGGAIAYPLYSGAPEVRGGLAVAVLVVGWISGVCLILGLLPEVGAAAGAVTCLLTLLCDQQLYSSHVTLLIILLVLLACARSDWRWGISGQRYGDSSSVPWWPQLLMMTQVSVVYLFAGLSKLQPTFLSGRPLSGWMWLDLPPRGYAVLAWATVVTEIGLAFALWIPRTRRAATVLGGILHLSIVTLLSGGNLWLVAFALTTMSTYPLFLTRPMADSDAEPFARRLSPRLQSQDSLAEDG